MYGGGVREVEAHGDRSGLPVEGGIDVEVVVFLDHVRACADYPQQPQ